MVVASLLPRMPAVVALIPLAIGIAVTMIAVSPPQVIVSGDSIVQPVTASSHNVVQGTEDAQMETDRRAFVAGLCWGIGLTLIFMWPRGRTQGAWR